MLDRWMQEGTTDRRGRSASTSVHHITRVVYPARRPLLGLHRLTQDHRRLRRQWCYERWMWVAGRNEVAFTDCSHASRLQYTMGRIRVWRHHGEDDEYFTLCTATLVTLGIMVWGGIGYQSHTPLYSLPVL
ncbi:transposable element Tcb1 transposase [Trichonephila clavipes]|nr:transposable element Tcb1 transposase [Trichonephila clavipes]